MPALPGRRDSSPRRWTRGCCPCKKNGSGIKRGAYLDAAAGFLGLGLREALLLPVGLVFDLMDLKVERMGGGKKK